MSDEQAVRSASASVIGELGTALRHAVLQLRVDDATARRSSDERTTNRLAQIDHRLEEISARLWSTSSARIAPDRFSGFFVGPIAAVIVVVILAFAGAIGGKLVGDRAYASGRAVVRTGRRVRARPPGPVACVSAHYGLAPQPLNDCGVTV